MFRPSENVKISESFVKKECEIWSKLNHDNITDLYEVVEEKDNPYPVLILKLMDTSLRKFLERNKEFPFRSKFRILLQIARALVYLHDKGYTHGDLTANNVLLQLEGRYILAQLSDFGMSRVAEEDIHGNTTTNTAGVAAYMAPEVIDGQPVMASDIYSFGILIIHTVIQKFPKPCHATRKDGPSAQLTALTEYQRYIKIFAHHLHAPLIYNKYYVLLFLECITLLLSFLVGLKGTLMYFLKRQRSIWITLCLFVWRMFHPADPVL